MLHAGADDMKEIWIIVSILWPTGEMQPTTYGSDFDSAFSCMQYLITIDASVRHDQHLGCAQKPKPKGQEI